MGRSGGWGWSSNPPEQGGDSGRVGTVGTGQGSPSPTLNGNSLRSALGASEEHGVSGRKLRDWMGGLWGDREGQFQDTPPPQTLHQRTLTFSPSGPAGPLSPSRPGSPWKARWEKTRRHYWGGAPCAFPSSPSLEQDPQPLISGQWGLAHTQWGLTL